MMLYFVPAKLNFAVITRQMRTLGSCAAAGLLLLSTVAAAEERQSYLIKLHVGHQAEVELKAASPLTTRMMAVSERQMYEPDEDELESVVADMAEAVLADLPVSAPSKLPAFSPASLGRNARAMSTAAAVEERAPAVEQVFSRAYQGFEVRLTAAEAAALADDPRVAEVHQSLPIQVDAVQTPVPSWGLDRIDQSSLPLNDLYEYRGDGRGVHVYVIDTGIRSSHSEFAGRIGRGYDFADSDSDPNDCKGHGTSVASVLAGSTVGVAKSATVHGLKVANCAGAADTTKVIKALEWVLKNGERPAVINISMSTPQKWKPQDDAVAKTVSAGIAVVVSAGNGGTDACGYSPAGADPAITVGSTDRNDRVLGSSNYGACVDIFAPGEGLRVASHSGDKVFSGASGTSFAAPMVAGALAVLLEDNPNASPSALLAQLKNLARRNKLTALRGASPNLLLGLGESSSPLPLPPAGEDFTDQPLCGTDGKSCAPADGATIPARPICASTASDPDGDGFGWENGRTCIVTATSASTVTAPPATGGRPYCELATSDPDGDGFGWERGRTCIAQPNTIAGFRPACASAGSDPDGDGFGWENGMTCVVR